MIEEIGKFRDEDVDKITHSLDMLSDWLKSADNIKTPHIKNATSDLQLIQKRLNKKQPKKSEQRESFGLVYTEDKEIFYVFSFAYERDGSIKLKRIVGTTNAALLEKIEEGDQVKLHSSIYAFIQDKGELRLEARTSEDAEKYYR